MTYLYFNMDTHSILYSLVYPAKLVQASRGNEDVDEEQVVVLGDDNHGVP